MVRPLVPRNWRLQPPPPASPPGLQPSRFRGGREAIPSDHPNKHVEAARKRRITLSKVSIVQPKEDD